MASVPARVAACYLSDQRNAFWFPRGRASPIAMRKRAAVAIAGKVAVSTISCAKILPAARMVKLVDTRDLKSRARKGVPVRFRFRAPAMAGFCLVQSSATFSAKSILPARFVSRDDAPHAAASTRRRLPDVISHSNQAIVATGAFAFERSEDLTGRRMRIRACTSRETYVFRDTSVWLCRNWSVDGLACRASAGSPRPRIPAEARGRKQASAGHGINFWQTSRQDLSAGPETAAPQGRGGQGRRGRADIDTSS